MKISTAENFTRSAKAPRISAQVMRRERGLEGDEEQLGNRRGLARRSRAMANAPVAESNVPLRNSRSKPPMKALPSVNASE